MNNGLQALDVRGNLKLEGGGNRKTGDFGFVRVPAGGSPVEYTSQMSTYGGSLDNTVLTVNITQCSQVPRP